VNAMTIVRVSSIKLRLIWVSTGTEAYNERRVEGEILALRTRS
jgi:hypothetical protein